MDTSRTFFGMFLTAVVIMSNIVTETEGKPSPALVPIHNGFIFQTIPQASQQTTVVRDFLGNQGTAYAYQTSDGISSSAVAVSRSDNSKTLAYLPVPVAHHHQPLVYAHHQYPLVSPAAAYTNYGTYVV